MKIFANPNLPQIDDYYEPFTFDYDHLQSAPEMKAAPTARPRSLITGQRMEKIEWGPNWEEILGGEFSKRSKDKNFEDIQKDIYGQFENTFMMYLPRLCEHCLNPACVASCPSGSIYKREEDGIVLIDQDKCRGWRMCVSGCPYKKIYYNWKSGKAEKCIFCYPASRPASPPCARNLRGPHPLPGRAAVRRRPHRGGRQRGARQGPVPGPARHLPRPARPGRDRAGPPRRHPRSLADRRATARSTRWRGLEGRAAAAPRVPHPAHGLVRAAAVAHHRRGHAGHVGRTARCPTCSSCASGAVPGQPADRRRHRPGGARAGAHAGHARLPARQACGRRAQHRGAGPGRPERGRGRGHVPHHGDRQLRGPLRHPDHAPRVRRERLRRARRLRLLFGNGCSDGTTETSLFGSEKKRTIPIKAEF
jgi:nitrate reductase beta subunit